MRFTEGAALVIRLARTTLFLPGGISRRSLNRAAWHSVLGVALAGFLFGPRVAGAQSPAPGSVVTWGRVYVNHQDSVPVTPVAEVLSNVTAVATGNPWSIAARTDGSVVIWVSDWLSPHGVIPGITPASGVRKVIGGYSPPPFFDPNSLAAALKSDGSVMLWRFGDLDVTPESLRSGVLDIVLMGNLVFAALEDGRIIASPPQFVPANLKPPLASVGAVALAGGAAHLVVLRTDGSVMTLGGGIAGTVPAAAQSDVIAIAAGLNHSLALRRDGTVVAWGSNDSGESEVPEAARTGVVAIAAGWLHSVALKADGTVVTWGAYQFGQANVLSEIQGLVSGISAGEYHTVALVASTPPVIATPLAGRSVPVGNRPRLSIDARGPNLKYQWRKDGVNIPGGTQREYTLPSSPAGEYTVVVTNPFGVVTSAPPAVVTVVPNAPGAVVAWGAGVEPSTEWLDEGQSAVPAEALSGVVAVAAGVTHSAALKVDGSVVFWGDADQYYFKGGLPVGMRQGITAIASGDYHLLALTADGSVIGWGENGNGQTSIPEAARSNVVAVAAGEAFSLALTANGAVVAWGNNGSGQTNVPNAARSGVVAISAAGGLAIALKSDGSAIAWGSGSKLSDAALGGLSVVTAGRDSLGLKPDGSVVSLGAGDALPLAARTGVVGIQAGLAHSVALKADGTLVTWGSDNDYGQLDIPTFLQGRASGVAVGQFHTLAILGTAALQARLANGAIHLSWPINLVGFHVEVASEFNASSWQPVPEVPTISGTHSVLTRSVPAGREFYRLNR